MEGYSLGIRRASSVSLGCSLARAREIYTKVIGARAAIGYGASAWHEPSEAGATPRGVARYLDTVQSDCLCTVTGGYRVTQVRYLEVEAVVLLIDIYLNKRVVEFENQLELTGMLNKVYSTCIPIVNWLR